MTGATRQVATDSIEIETSTGSVVIDRRDVHRVLRTRSRAARRAAWGLAIGAVGGVLQAVLLTESDHLQFAGIFGGGWAAIGGTIGALSGLGQAETLVVYAAIDPNPELPNHQMQPTRRVTRDGARLICGR